MKKLLGIAFACLLLILPFFNSPQLEVAGDKDYWIILPLSDPMPTPTEVAGDKDYWIILPLSASIPTPTEVAGDKDYWIILPLSTPIPDFTTQTA